VPGEDALYVQSVEKAFRVLDAVGRGRPGMGLTELAAAAGLDRSAAQRFSHTLERLGYLRKDARTRRFELTARTLDLGAMYIRSNALVDRALPYLIELSRRTEEAVSLSVLDGIEIVYVARLLSRNAMHANIVIGSRLPAYCTAPGTAILSRLPRPEAFALLERSDRRAHTAHTTTALPALRRRLEETARRGYVVMCEELFVNDISLAAPVLGRDGEPLAAVNIAVSKLRCPVREAERRYAPLITDAAAAMSAAVPATRP
jgi:DNA-binding IclR family transcriptional regulator